ncbi:MAG TPA: hypothetical protein V6D11_32040 [Waterburya sp.]|jgi:hypothetical protein
MNKFIGYFIALPISLMLGSVSLTLSELGGTAAIVAQNSSRSYQPLPAATCNQLKQEMTKVLKVKVTMTRAAFQDSVSGKRGTSCQLTATGNGRNFTKVSRVVRSLSTILTKQGWVEASNYVADGPTGAARGFHKGNSLAMFYVEWEPSSDAKCPDDQPISDCELLPEQQLYRITLNAARG